MSTHPIDVAVQVAGSYEALGDLLGVSKAAVHQWKQDGRAVPIEHCWSIEKYTGVSRQSLRPNDWKKIWPELAA